VKAVIAAEDARALAVAAREIAKAREALELATARAKVPLMEAVLAQNALVETLATRYGFDADQPITFDARTRTITQEAEAAPVEA
jgi:hypothetical protein